MLEPGRVEGRSQPGCSGRAPGSAPPQCPPQQVKSVGRDCFLSASLHRRQGAFQAGHCRLQLSVTEADPYGLKTLAVFASYHRTGYHETHSVTKLGNPERT